MARTLSDGGAAALISAVAAESNEELASGLAQDFALMSAAQGRILLRLGEYERRQAFRDDGATSLESWTAERFGVSTPTARTYAQVGHKAWDLPQLVGALCAGEVSLDKVRVLADVATPESDEHLRETALRHSVRELADIARSWAERARSASSSSSRSQHEGRYLRCNDEQRTLSAQLPAESYAEAKACLEAQVRAMPSDGDTPLDQRRCDAFMGIIRSVARGSSSAGGASAASPFLVVAHVPLAALVEGAGQETALAAELECGGLIDTETVRRLACDATVVVGIDDDVGHTMYEGRDRRFPSDAQRREVMRRDRVCRFPGCTNKTFTNVHHIVAWNPGGCTDLDNLALLCLFHHGVVHQRGWTMSGNANAELTFVGPSGRVMTSRPSRLWTRVTAAEAAVSTRQTR
jgi:hypothetical protein